MASAFKNPLTVTSRIWSDTTDRDHPKTSICAEVSWSHVISFKQSHVSHTKIHSMLEQDFYKTSSSIKLFCSQSEKSENIQVQLIPVKKTNDCKYLALHIVIIYPLFIYFTDTQFNINCIQINSWIRVIKCWSVLNWIISPDVQMFHKIKPLFKS